MASKFFVKWRKYLIIITFSYIFFGTLISNIPAWVLSSQLSKYSNHQLALYNLSGSFWNGSGLLVVAPAKKNPGGMMAPIVHLQWRVSLGLTKYINIQFHTKQQQLANVYLNTNGLNIDHLDLSLSIAQLSYLSDLVKDLNLSGNLRIAAKHLLFAQKVTGLVNINVDNVSSGMSPVNPLGSYRVLFNMASGAIRVSNRGAAVLSLRGSGSFNGLILKATIEPDKVAQMQTFITLLGVPNADGTYNIRLF